MNKFTLNDLSDALIALRFDPNAPLVVHSSLFQLGMLADVSIDDYPRKMFAALREILGPNRTLCFPASMWDYGDKKIPFDLRRSPVARQLGVLSAHVVSLPTSRRSKNPIFSLAAVGPEAEYICSTSTATAFGYDSAWDRLHQLNGEMLFLGCDLTYTTYVRYIEARYGVPYLYNKLFETPVLEAGVDLHIKPVALLRYMHCPVTYELSRLEDRLRNLGLLREAKIHESGVKAVRMGDCFAAGMAALKEDLHFFLKAPPPYRPEELPLA